MLVLEEGDEVAGELARLAEREGVGAASFAAIGVFSEVEWGYFDRDEMDYERTRLDGEVEVLSLSGNVSVHKGAPVVHAHVSVAGRDGVARGGHLFEGRVWPTLEVTLVESPETLERREDPENGFALIAP